MKDLNNTFWVNEKIAIGILSYLKGNNLMFNKINDNIPISFVDMGMLSCVKENKEYVNMLNDIFYGISYTRTDIDGLTIVNNPLTNRAIHRKGIVNNKKQNELIIDKLFNFDINFDKENLLIEIKLSFLNLSVNLKITKFDIDRRVGLNFYLKDSITNDFSYICYRIDNTFKELICVVYKNKLNYE